MEKLHRAQVNEILKRLFAVVVSGAVGSKGNIPGMRSCFCFESPRKSPPVSLQDRVAGFQSRYLKSTVAPNDR
jgi:hypothetical protein